MENANGSGSTASVTPIDAPSSASSGGVSGIQAALTPSAVQSQGAGLSPLGPVGAHRPAMIAPHHVHGSVLEGGDSPAVLAQPAAATSEGQGSQFHPSHVARRARRSLSHAHDAMSSRYRRVSDNTDDYVHDNPWKSIAFAAVGGLLIGLLVSC
ncbi:hypothetical protein BVER_03176c [Candidatus Burkholderia verschuerenii]|uniref:DUF883 domain-containing protein n=1 Tax=Candidatus Burkholderia verschuerenii TaxID=242163 RepID=A0A0L0M7R1_9BURK|nr:DUF883 domain-containing protein [Candidatus Burkholderia verschuerenii]KND58692.1 hypothetical protein BVER_03176c [Candidatus Burkholderia verschuerenii]